MIELRIDLTGLRNMPDTIQYLAMVSGTLKTLAVPSGARKAVFSFDSDVYVSNFATLAVNTSDAQNNTVGELNPTMYNIEGVSNIYLISQYSCNVTVAFYL